MIPDPTHINLIMVHGDRACLPISTEPGWPSVMFSNRQEAGKKLAQAIRKLNIPDPVILALPRGGVPIAREVADALDAPLELIMVRKIGVPMQPELAAAAVVNGRKPEIVINKEVARMAGLSDADIQELAKTQLEEIKRRRALYLGNQSPISLEGKVPIIVDDGLATGTTALAAVRALKLKQSERVVLAVPVAPRGSLEVLKAEGAETVCLAMPEPFHAISIYYDDFHQLTDKEVISLLKSTNNRHLPD